MKSSLTELMQRIQDNSDQQAFQLLFDCLWEPLYQFAFSFLRDGGLAKDLVQEVWIDFWTRKKEIQNQNIQAYLFQAVRYKVYRELKGNRLVELCDKHLNSFFSESDNPNTILEYNETSEQMLQEVEKLPDKCRMVFELSRYEGLKNAEIASALGISVRTVENHISHALKILRKKSW